jgi:pimeloyl-ACP methyl ester carboxylesterase
VIFRSRRPAERSRRPLTSHRIGVDGLRVHTSVAGAGPPVVLVHGFGVSGRYMLPLCSLARRPVLSVRARPARIRAERKAGCAAR